MPADDPFPWDALLRGVRAQYPDLYRSWFEDLQPEVLTAGQLRIPVPDQARARYLTERCTQAFVQAATALTGHLISVSFPTAWGAGTIIRSTDRERVCLTPMPVNADHTFDEFVVGPSNRLAHAACRAVCAQPGTLYNPLFVHGASGLGKTHLLQAACAALQSVSPPPDVIYVSCESFMNDFVRAIEAGQLAAFRDAARLADVLIIDDIQFLADRESGQDEFFHTFNVLYQSRRQIILSADSPPNEIPKLEDRLVSRFHWGLVAQIDPPDRETRHAILQKKARLRAWEVGDDVLDYIAEHVDSNIRLLEGALTKLIVECQVSGRPLSVKTARQVVNGPAGAGRRPPSIGEILKAVSEHFGVRLSELLGRRRTLSITRARQTGMYLARKLTALSLEEIGGHFGGRDHSTVLHAERVIEAKRARERQVCETIARLTQRLLAQG